MRRIIIVFIILLACLAIGAGWSQTTSVAENESAEFYISGEHYPVIYSGSGVIFGSAHACTTRWVQVGYSSSATSAANRNIGRFDPELFTAELKLRCYGNGDSARVAGARFETAYDTTGKAFWNGDSSNRFIQSGNFSHPDYGVWRFETLTDSSRRWIYPLRLLVGGYARLILSSDTWDSTNVDWRLICEH